MRSQRIAWTALPWGHDPTTQAGRLSAFLSLRLQTDEVARPTLEADFPDIARWGEIAAGARFAVRVEGSAGETQLIGATAQAPAVEPLLWETLFPGTSWVRPFVFADHSTREIRSYSVVDVLRTVRESYSELAAHAPEELPPVGRDDGARHNPLADLVDRLGGLLGVGDERERPEVPKPGRSRPRRRMPGARELQRAQYGPGRIFGSGPAAALDPGSLAPGSTERHFAEAYSFYHREATRDAYRREPLPGFVAPPVTQREIDVHDMLALLADHPRLLRRLGLVIDLQLDEPLIAAAGRLRLAADYADAPEAATEHVAPWTRFVHSAARFAAAPAGDIADGMLALDGAGAVPGAGKFDVTQIDPDGAALKLLNATSTMKALAVGARAGYASYDTPDTGSVPTLRAAGLAIVRTRRADALRDRLNDAAAHDAADPAAVELDAAALTRGYRVDVEAADAPGTWLSLHRRSTTFTHGGQAVGEDAGDGPEEYSGEGYVKGTSASSTPGGDELYLHETLARWAGWSLSAERPGRVIYPEPGPDNTQAEHVALRRPNVPDPKWPFDARHTVAPRSLPRLRFGATYRLRARAVDLAGNSLPRTSALDDHASAPVRYLRWEPVAAPDLVALAAFAEGASLEHLVIRSTPGVAAADYHETGRDESSDARHVLPPKTAVDMAEAHGALDAIADDRAAYEVARREQGLLRGGPSFQKVAGAAGAPPAVGGDADADPPGTYWIHPDAPLVLPYLPDVLSAGVAVREIGGAPLHRSDWGGEPWPDARPILLQIVEAGAGVPRADFDAPHRVLSIALEKAEVLRVRLSSTLDDKGLDVLGVFDWALAAADDDAQRDALRRLALQGRHWMLTPRRELALVHAVQRPLWAPKVVAPTAPAPGDPPSDAPDGFHADRTQVGQTHASLSADVDLSVRSSGQIDIDAAWTEHVDDVEHARPDTVPTAGRVSTLRVPAWMSDGVNELPFHDTPPPATAAEKRRWRAAPVRHEFGDTKHREVTYTLTAGTRFREYFPTAITDDPSKITQQGAGSLAHVRSSARPAAPLPRYAIPTFGWERTGFEPGWTSARSVRAGGGVRVWMDRPWFSSGVRERLGVVLFGSSDAVPDALRPLVSQYGRDPIWETEAPAHVLRPHDFAGHIAAEARAAGLTLNELGDGGSVGVVPYEPQFDETRGLWYADVRLPGKAAASYTPFVRLAIARYQPWSLFGVELSRVAQLDFLQLVPTRTLKLARTGNAVQLSLTGVAPDGPRTNEVHVTVEMHDGTIPGDMGWRPVRGHEAVQLHEGVSNPGRWLERAGVIEALRSRALVQRLGLREAPRAGDVAASAPGDLRVVPMLSAREFAEIAPAFGNVELGRIDVDIPLIVLPGHRMWSGGIGLPDVSERQRLRLVVREVEVIDSDREAVGSHDPERTHPPARRIVYLETIEL